jgi:hypothetical protein
MQIKSTYTTPWYEDMLPLPVHPLRCHHNILDKDWDTSSQESAESINAPPSPTQTLRRRRHKIEQNVDLLNEVAAQRNLPGYQVTHIAVDANRKGLCLKASQPIPATTWMNKTGLCEYSGTERPVDPQEHVNSIPLRQLMYGCEYYRDGKLYRKSPDQDLDSLLRYMQAPNPGEEPTCRLMIVKDKAKSTMSINFFPTRYCRSLAS